jgi:hypothetical protein
MTFLTGLIKALLPSKTGDSDVAERTVRLNAFSELAVRDTPANYYGMAEEGSLIVATNPTVSTGMTFVTAQTAFSDTVPNFYIYNTEPVGGRSLRLHYLKMITTAAGTSATAWHYAVILDQVGRAIGTDNTATITPVNPNGAATISAVPLIKVQNSATASAIAASSASKRLVARGCLGGLNIVGDTLQIYFGEMTPSAMSATAVTQAGQPGRRVDNSPPVMIPPGCSAVIHIWGVASAAAFSPEFELLMSLK